MFAGERKRIESSGYTLGGFLKHIKTEDSNIPKNSPLMDSSTQETIVIVGTGGTIAGTSKGLSDSSLYTAGTLKLQELMESVPELKNFNKLEAKDLFNIDSSDITPKHWLQLAKEVNALLERPDVKGVVITHGTDTLEETAYFLDLVIKSKKPVVLVGSMRPATSLSPDGPMNLLNAMHVVNAAEAPGRGVLAVINDTIFDARDVTKTHTTHLNTFSAPNSGPVGSVTNGKVRFNKKVERKHTDETPFNIDSLEDLPNVEIVYEYAGSEKVLKAVIDLKPDGIVIAGTGDGNMTAADKALMQYAREQGIEIIRSSRTGSGEVTYDNVDQLDSKLGLIPGDNLNPQKARILLMLSLLQRKLEPDVDIKQNFRLF
jgi:L-asparaginase